MSQPSQSDPFTETPVHQQSTMPPQQSQQAPVEGASAYQGSAVNPGYGYGNSAYYGGHAAGTMPGYGAGMPYGGYSGAPALGGTYGGMYSAGYAPAYGGNYGMPYGGTGYAMSRQGAIGATAQAASGARDAGAAVLSGMHDAMSRFARVSGMIEEVLRNLHMLFDAVFGLGYSLGAFRQEARLWMAIKTGPVGFALRVLRRAANVWRLLCLFFMSPMAGRFSPVALVLRILGLVPEEDPLEFVWPQTEQQAASVEEVREPWERRIEETDMSIGGVEPPSDASNM